MVRIAFGAPGCALPARPRFSGYVGGMSPAQVVFGGDLTPKPPGYQRRVTVTSPWLDRLPAGCRPQAQAYLDTMGHLLKALTEVYYSEWIRRFNEAKAAFQNLVAREAQGLDGYDPRRAYRRLRRGAARPIPFELTLSHSNLLENRN